MFAKLFVVFMAASAVLAAPIESEIVEKRTTHYTGHGTYYTVSGSGDGACGWENTDSEYVVALNKAQYKSESDGTSNKCGKKVVITNTEKDITVTAKIVDECPGCKKGSLDMSPKVFGKLNKNDYDEGVFPIKWYYKS